MFFFVFKCVRWCFTVQKADAPRILQIWFIESILNTVGAAKSPIYCKHLISSGCERLELVLRMPEPVSTFAVQTPPRLRMPQLCQWPFVMHLCNSLAGVIYSEPIVLRGCRHGKIARLGHVQWSRWGERWRVKVMWREMRHVCLVL